MCSFIIAVIYTPRALGRKQFSYGLSYVLCSYADSLVFTRLFNILHDI